MNNKIKYVLLICLSACLYRLNATTLLNSFGTNDFITYTAPDGAVTQTSTSATFSASGSGLVFGGDFTNSVNLSLMGTPGYLELNLSFLSTYNGKLDVVIGTYNHPTTGTGSVSYSMTANNLSGTQVITFLRDANPESGTLNLSAINFASITAESPNFTLNTLSAFAGSPIPEPATYAALFGLGVLGMAAFRRRRIAA